jgi:hypothetical protein
MSAHPAMFPPWLQEPMEAGHLSPLSAWRLEWELIALQDQPWTEGVYELNLRVSLFHWEPYQTND